MKTVKPALRYETCYARLQREFCLSGNLKFA